MVGWCSKNLSLCLLDYFFIQIDLTLSTDLQCCVSFCCAIQLYVYIYISPPPRASLPPAPIPPLQVPECTELSSPVLHCRFPLATCFTRGSAYMSVLPSPFIPLPFPHYVQSPFSKSASAPPNRFISSIFLGSIYMC